MNAIVNHMLAACMAQGAVQVEAAILQPADVLLDLYGEDIRGRAYVTQDPDRGEMMLRPDFTVPVVQRHMAESAEPARYTYAGPVFRKQENQPDRPSEYMQVGYEVFDRGNPAQVEAEVFGLFQQALAGHGQIFPAVGDVGLLLAAVDGLTTSDARKAALKRHIWRPARFNALLERFSAPVATPTAAPSGPQIGLRSGREIEQRLAVLEADAQTAPLDAGELAALRSVLQINAPFDQARAQLEQAAAGFAAISGAVETIAARYDTFAASGIGPQGLKFQAAYGLSAMEYYDGFVFGIYTPGHRAAVASGGRYDALTRILGQGRSVPAVGGVLRPELVGGMQHA